MKKILAFLPNTFADNYIVILDEIQKKLDEGHEVTLISCDAGIRHCDYNITGNCFICNACCHCLKQSIKFLKGNYKVLKIEDFITEDDNFAIKNINLGFKDLNNLKKFEYNNYDIGYAVLSTYIDFTRNLNPKFTSKFNNFIKYLFIDSMTIYNAYEKVIEKINPENILVYNGRLHTTKPALVIANRKGIKIDIIEVIGGHGDKKIEKVKYENSLPHSINYNSDLIKTIWDNADKIEREIIANEFFIRRRQGAPAADRSYTKNQTSGRLPVNFDSEKTNIAIFNSSNDEFASIGPEWKWDIFGGDQQIAIEKIADMFLDNDDIHIYLRVHPNLKNVKYKYHNDYYNLHKRYSNLTVIEATSKINSYSLLDACAVIVTFGSTIGVEATYWGKPSILIGKSMYMNLDVTYNPISENEFKDLVLNKRLIPKDKESALKYGNYLYGRKGEILQHFDSNLHRKFPRFINQNLYLYNLDKQKRITSAVILNFLYFTTARLLKNIVLHRRIPREGN